YREPGSRHSRRVVDDVSLLVHPHETVALVGESGSGKSTLAMIALLLVKPDEGDVLLDGRQIATLSRSQLRAERRRMQPSFPHPGASFNPRRRVGSAMRQALRARGIDDKAEANGRTEVLLEQVGLRPASRFLRRWPHELSGGQRQRLAIARALAMEPDIIIA